jgi:hypothetical protein
VVASKATRVELRQHPAHTHLGVRGRLAQVDLSKDETMPARTALIQNDASSTAGMRAGCRCILLQFEAKRYSSSSLPGTKTATWNA